jgi:hypothetical protein
LYRLLLHFPVKNPFKFASESFLVAFSPRGILVISHEISAERYFKVPHLSHWFVLVRFVKF